MKNQKLTIYKKYEIIPITNQKFLFESLKFLQKEFSWSEIFFQNFYKKLIKKKYKQDLYGYSLVKKETIFGSIIFINQGNVNKKGSLINISSWYMKEEVRGMISIIFLKKIISLMPDNILTSLTANKESRLIYKSLGFNENSTYNYKISFIKIITKYLLMNRSYKADLFLSKKQTIPSFCNSVNIRDAKFISIYINKKKLDFIYSNATKEVNLFLLTIRLKGLRILWVSDELLYKKFFNDICWFFLKRNFLFFLTSHCVSNRTITNDFKNNCHLYFSKKDKKPELITLGSELSFDL